MHKILLYEANMTKVHCIKYVNRCETPSRNKFQYGFNSRASQIIL
jgi:hypothetical protein